MTSLLPRICGLLLLLFLAQCGKKSSDDPDSGRRYKPADWDGLSDYGNSVWNFLSL